MSRPASLLHDILKSASRRRSSASPARPAGIENKLVPREGYPLDAIEIIGLSRSMSPKGILHNIKAAKLAVSAVAKAKKLLKAARPDCVIGCGGYASFAVVKAAQELGIPTVLLEVNALPGKVTQMLAKKADRVLVCFEQAKKLLGGDEKIILTGAPVRGEILAASREKARAKFGLGENDQLVVSFWGSMGAKYMNEHMAGTLALERRKRRFLPPCPRHRRGGARLAAENGAASRARTSTNHPNIQYTEYIYDMADRMAAADLIVCRAGAATLGELCMLGRPALLVPSPFVAENHQEKNARALESAGGCRVLLEKDATPQKLYDEIGDMLSDPLRLHAMGENATVLAAHDASEKIYREILRAIENHGK